MDQYIHWGHEDIQANTMNKQNFLWMDDQTEVYIMFGIKNLTEYDSNTHTFWWPDYEDMMVDYDEEFDMSQMDSQ